MGKGHKLLDDISVSEMMRMREEEGLSNYEIAMRLGVTPTTILRHIGKQPRGYKVPRSYRPASVPVNVDRPKEEEVVPACLVLEMRMYQLVGSFATYRVCDRDKTLQITTKDGDQIELDLECIGDFINELHAIRRKMSSPAPMEAW